MPDLDQPTGAWSVALDHVRALRPLLAAMTYPDPRGGPDHLGASLDAVHSIALASLEGAIRHHYRYAMTAAMTGPGRTLTVVQETVAWPRGRCDSCGADVVWARHERTGKRAPIDWLPAMPDAEPPGNVELVARGVTDGKANSVEYRVHAQPPLGAQFLRLNHFATCPDADAWAGGRRGA